jgi:competence protein ComEC
VLIRSADLVTLAPWMSWRVPPPSFLSVVIFYASLAGLSVPSGASWRRRRLAAGLATIATAAVVLFAPGLERARPPDGVLRVTMMDVGQGDALLVQLPDRHALLVDGGGTSGSFDLGGRIVVPAVWALGVRQLDWIAVTHPDVDHIGGLSAALSDLQPREVWEAVPVPPHPLRAALLVRAREQHIVWRQLLAGHALEVAGVVIDVRHPPPPEWERQRTRNDDSLVLQLRYGQVEVLLTGDAGTEFERHEIRALESEEHRAPLRILKVGHHGSLSASAVPFLRALRPHVALVSAGRSNLFGHPAPEIVARLEDLDAEIFRTDRDGAVIVETDGRTVWVRTMTGRTWRLDVMRQ